MGFKRLVIGQRTRQIPAGTINRILAELERLGGMIGAPPGPADQSGGGSSHILPVLAKNTTESDLIEFGIAGVDVSAFDFPDIEEGSSPPYDDDNEADSVLLGPPVLEIVTPTADHAENRKWVVTLQPIAAGETGYVAVSGLVPARVDVTDDDHECADIESGDTRYLKSASSGVPIWYRKLQDESGGTGKQWALVLLGGGGGGTDGAQTALVKLTSPCPGRVDSDTPGTTTDYDVIRGTLEDTPAAENWADIELPTGTYCGLVTIAGSWTIYPAFC